MSEEKEVITEDEEVITQDEEIDAAKGSEVSKETLIVQKRKALEQRDKERKEKEELQKKLAELTAKSVASNDKPANAPNSSDVEELKKVILSTSEQVERITFAQTHPEIEPNVISEIFALSKSNNKKPEETLELPMVKAYLKDLEDKRKAEQASANSNRSAKTPNGKSWSEMSSDEKKAYTTERWNKAMRGEL